MNKFIIKLAFNQLDYLLFFLFIFHELADVDNYMFIID